MPLQAHTVKRSNLISQPDANDAAHDWSMLLFLCSPHCRRCCQTTTSCQTQRRVTFVTSHFLTPTLVGSQWQLCVRKEPTLYLWCLVHPSLFLLLPSRFLPSSLLPPLLYYPPPFLLFALTHTHTHVGCMGDTQFHFRVRCSGPGAGGSKMHHTIDHHGAPLVLMVKDNRH